MTFDFWGTLVDVDKSGRIGMAKMLAELGLAHLDAAQLYDEWDVETVRQYRSTTWRPYLSSSEAGLRMTIESWLMMGFGVTALDAVLHLPGWPEAVFLRP